MEMKWLPEYKRYVTDDGRVFRINQDGILTECKLHTGSRGYLQVHMCVGTTTLVHRLVALAFHGPAPHDRPYVDHINRVRNDNRAENLRWVTATENVKNSSAYKTGRYSGVDPAITKRLWRADHPEQYKAEIAALTSARRAKGEKHHRCPDGKQRWHLPGQCPCHANLVKQ